MPLGIGAISVVSICSQPKPRRWFVDFRRKRSPHQLVSIQGEDFEVVHTYIYQWLMISWTGPLTLTPPIGRGRADTVVL